MSPFGWLLDRFAQWPDRPAIIEDSKTNAFGGLIQDVEAWRKRLRSYDVSVGHVVALQGDYSKVSIPLLLALFDLGTVVAPLTPGAGPELAEYIKIAEIQKQIWIDSAGAVQHRSFEQNPSHPLTRSLIDTGRSGLILFSSGSTGKPKASLHDMERFSAKFKEPRAALRTVAVPPMDHVAGLDTLFYCLSSGGTLVCVRSRDPEMVCAAIAQHRAELLPASAAFLNLLLVSEAYQRHDLSSLRIVAYGSDVMPPHTLARLREIMPNTNFVQKYGTTEFGSPRTTSRSPESVWMKFQGDGIESRIVDGVLWIRSQSAMLGYLNAPSPFEADGWINTQDAVEVDGDYIRILGRKSDMVNIGGQKVYPAEVENVILQMENVRDAAVFGVDNPIMGKVLMARVTLDNPEPPREFKKRLRDFCEQRLAAFKIPVRIEFTDSSLVSPRQKKLRQPAIDRDPALES